MQEILPGVFLAPQNGGKGFGYSHFVKRPGGNLMLDASRVGSLSDAFDSLEAEGGVKAAVISDRRLGGKSTNEVAARFGATIYCSQIEAEAMGHRVNQVVIDHALPFERTTIVVAPWTSYAQTEFFGEISSVDRTVDEMIAACPKP